MRCRRLRAALKLLDHVNQANDALVMCVGRPSQLDIDHRQPGHGDGDDMPSEPVDGAVADNGEQLSGGDQVDEGIQADRR